MKQLGIGRRGVINYPRQRKREEVELTPEAERELLKVLKEIKEIEELPLHRRPKNYLTVKGALTTNFVLWSEFWREPSSSQAVG